MISNIFYIAFFIIKIDLYFNNKSILNIEYKMEQLFANLSIEDDSKKVDIDIITELPTIEVVSTNSVIKNKGTGAGGANTNYHGKKFEDKTNNEQRLLEAGYIKNSFSKRPKKRSKSNSSKKTFDYYLSKTFEDKTIIFLLQSGLKTYIKNKYNIELFRCPDEAYIIEYNDGRKIIKILEKKEQNVEGSVETKLWSGPSLKREYELVLGKEFTVYYGFCLSAFLTKKLTSTEKKYNILNTILNESSIALLFGDNDNYFETFDKWLADNM